MLSSFNLLAINIECGKSVMDNMFLEVINKQQIKYVNKWQNLNIAVKCVSLYLLNQIVFQ